MVGIGAFPVRIAAASRLWAPGVLTPILAGNTAWAAGGLDDGDIGSGVDWVGAVVEDEITLDVRVIAG